MTYLEDLKSIVQLNSFTANKSGVDKNGEIFDAWMSELGFSVDVHTRELIGSHRHYKSSSVDGKKLLLVGHLDTVFPQDSFEEYKEDSEWIYGAGVCDMKGGNIVALQALRNIKSNGCDIKNIDMLLVSDEETGSDDSKYLSMKLAKDYDYAFVYEAAGKDLELVSGRKGVGTFTCNITGLAAHAGNHYKDGHDANLEASYKLQELVKLTDLAKNTTVNVGKIHGGIGANTISPHASITFEIRYTLVEEKDRVLSAIDEIINKNYVEGTLSTLSGGIQRDVMESSKKSLELIGKINEITKQNIKAEQRGGVSDANIFSSMGVITLDGFGPYGDGDHTIHERASKSSFESRIELSEKLFNHFIKNLDF
jgi:glutamate carboxypeptidase